MAFPVTHLTDTRRHAAGRARELTLTDTLALELAPALPLDQRLDAERHCEEPPILPMPVPTTVSPTGASAGEIGIRSGLEN